MKNLILILCSVSILVSFSLLPGNVGAASKQSLSVRQIMSKSSSAKAMSVLQKYLRKKPSAAKIKSLKQRSMAMQHKLRRPVFGVSLKQLQEDREYANLIRPVNFCTTLVIKTCGSSKQCPNSMGCPLSLQLLQIYNNETDPQEKLNSEYGCVIAQEDHAIFPQCE